MKTQMQLLWPGPEITRGEDRNECELGLSLWCIFGRWPLSFHLSTSGLIQPVLVTLTAQQLRILQVFAADPLCARLGE